MIMKNLALSLVLMCWVVATARGAEPTELREWHATSGHTVEAKALQVARGKVQLEKADGTKVVVPLDKFTAEDQDALRSHFGLEDEDTEEADTPPEGNAAEDLPHPLGGAGGRFVGAIDGGSSNGGDTGAGSFTDSSTNFALRLHAVPEPGTVLLILISTVALTRRRPHHF